MMRFGVTLRVRIGAVIALTVALMGVLAVGAAADDEWELSKLEIDAVMVAIDTSDSEFHVIYEQYVETATAAFFFGAIGAAVNSAQNQSQDETLAAPYVDAVSAIDFEQHLRAGAEKGFARSDEISLTDDEAAADLRLTMHVEKWGLMRVSSNSTELKPFLNLRLEAHAKDDRDRWSEVGSMRVHRTARNTANISDITPEQLVDDLAQLTERTGQRAAFEVVYH